MAKQIPKLLPPFFFILLSLLTLSSSGTHVGFSYDARGNKASSSPIETISFLTKNTVSPTQIKVLVTDNRVLKTLSNTGVLVDLFLNEIEVENLRISNASVISWLQTHLLAHLPYVNITSIIVSGGIGMSGKQLRSLYVTLKSIHSVLRSLGLNHKVKVGIAIPLSMLKSSQIWHGKDVHRVVDFIRLQRLFIVLETEISGALCMGDHFVGLVIKSAASAVANLHYKDVPIVLNVKSSVIPSAIEVAEFTKRMTTHIKSHAHMADRISGVLAQISPMEETEQKKLNWEEERIFHSSHRELLNSKVNTAVKLTLHDFINPPFTIPQVNPVPTIVTVPSTNPVIATPTNPTTNPVAVPATTPISIPPTNPATSPSMVPPMGNQVPPFVTVPTAPPAVINPMPPPGGIPMMPPVITPVVNPVTPPAITNPPTTSGQTWCVAKNGTMQSALQVALDYACGTGGADCSAIQLSGSCFNPNNLQSHASFAFNSYYQKNPVSSSCNFKGAAILVNANPSAASCIYPASLSSSSPPSLPPPATPLSSLPPPATPLSLLPPPFTTLSSPPPPATISSSSPPTTISSGLPPFMLNSTTPSIYGSSPPPDSRSSISVATGLQPLLLSVLLTPLIVAGKLWSM